MLPPPPCEVQPLEERLSTAETACAALRESERRRAEEQLRERQERRAFLLRLSDALRSNSDPAQIKNVALGLLGEHLSVNRAFYADEVTGPLQVSRWHERTAEPLSREPFSIAEYGDGVVEALTGGEPLVVTDVAAEPRFAAAEREARVARGIRAEVALPLVKRGRLVALLGVQAASPRVWSAQDLELLEQTAEHTWATVERAKAEGALRESEERQAFLLRLSDDMRPLGDAAQIQTLAMERLLERLNATRAGYYEFEADEDTFSLTARAERGATPLPERLRLSDFGPGFRDRYRAGQTLIDRDTVKEAPSDRYREAYRAIDVRARLSVPLVKDGRLLTVVGVHSRTPRDWTPAEVRLVEDVAERTWAAVERARAESALREANRRKDEFLAVLAHELRNGLAPLIYNVEIGNRSLDDAARLRQLFELNKRQLLHLVRLVDDLLDVTRISTGKIQLKIEVVKIREVVNQALDACRGSIDAKRHRLVLVDETDSELAVRGDRVRLTQVVSNLLSNASKYMDDGGTITVRIAREDDVVLVEVRDTGIGIPPEALPQVFDLFSQVRNRQEYTNGGVGIGLALVKRLTELQGGTVATASQGLGQGSNFTVRFPIAAARASSESLSMSDSEHLPRGLRVLVVDDLPAVADSLAEMLRLDGHEAEVAYGGAQAIESARRRRPDLVLLDLGMPGIDGFEVARQLRSEFTDGPPIRIVALSGWGQESDRERTRAASFDGHLIKPPREEDLRAVLLSTRSAKS